MNALPFFDRFFYQRCRAEMALKHWFCHHSTPRTAIAYGIHREQIERRMQVASIKCSTKTQPNSIIPVKSLSKLLQLLRCVDPIITDAFINKVANYVQQSSTSFIHQRTNSRSLILFNDSIGHPQTDRRSFRNERKTSHAIQNCFKINCIVVWKQTNNVPPPKSLKSKTKADKWTRNKIK